MAIFTRSQRLRQLRHGHAPAPAPVPVSVARKRKSKTRKGTQKGTLKGTQKGTLKGVGAGTQPRLPRHIAALQKALMEIGTRLIKAKRGVAVEDGRLSSMLSEKAVVNGIRSCIAKDDAEVIVPSARSWHDVAIKWGDAAAPYYFNIKISTGGQDNAFNKKALVFSLTTLSEESIPDCMSINTMFDLLMTHKRARRRQDCCGEYFYLYIDKRDGTVLIKSLCDIQAWASNPQNLLQINWRQEKAARGRGRGRKSVKIAPIRKRILIVIQDSLKKYFASCENLIKCQDM
jgi:hypothetical protein